MGLKIFNKTNSASKTANSTPSVYFAVKGCNNINAAGVAAMGLKVGDKIAIAQDEKDKRTFYIYKDFIDGFPLRAYDKGTNSLAFNNTLVAKAVVSNFTDGRGTASCRLITASQEIDGLTVYPIIVPKQA